MSDLRRVFGEMVELAGGVEWLALALGKPLSYASKISEAINGVEGRHIQFEEWLPPMLDCKPAMDRLYAWVCPRTQREVPAMARVATEGELLRALVTELTESGGIGEDALERAARRAGTDPGAFRR